jgi:hypothetical protein
VAGNLTLRTLSNAGDTTKGSPLTASEIDQNFINLRDASTITVLDDLTKSFDGVTKTFQLTANTAAVTPSNAHALLISLGSIILEPLIVTKYQYESYLFFQEFETEEEGNYSVSGSNITFKDAPSRAQKFYGRLLGNYVSNGSTETRNIFRPVPVVLS